MATQVPGDSSALTVGRGVRSRGGAGRVLRVGVPGSPPEWATVQGAVREEIPGKLGLLSDEVEGPGAPASSGLFSGTSTQRASECVRGTGPSWPERSHTAWPLGP